MRMEVCAVLDVKSGLYALPIFVASKGIALRMFADEINRSAVDNVMFKHPEDFCMYYLGVFDNVSGCFISNGVPVLLSAANDVKVS